MLSSHDHGQWKYICLCSVYTRTYTYYDSHHTMECSFLSLQISKTLFSLLKHKFMGFALHSTSLLVTRTDWKWSKQLWVLQGRNFHSRRNRGVKQFWKSLKQLAEQEGMTNIIHETEVEATSKADNAMSKPEAARDPKQEITIVKQ